MKWYRDIGPGILIAAAFIGPGTVTLCTIAGASFGYSLIWAILLSIFATIFLQELSLRIGLVSQKNIIEVIRKSIKSKLLNRFLLILIISSILIGNTAYEAGNITGASLGIAALLDLNSINLIPLIIGIIAFAILFQGDYRVLEKTLIALVVLMSISFIISAIITKPKFYDIVNGILYPKINQSNLFIVLGLIGTTVVPYNIFLHSSLVTEKWKSVKKIKTARLESFISILLGGVISLSIIITAASSMNQEITNVIDLAKGLEPLYGKFSIYFLGVGLFASGITSSITAPLAAAYVAKSCFGWNDTLKSIKFRLVWIFVLLFGVIVSLLDLNPIEIIKFAQFSNSLLLPIIAIILLWLVNKSVIIENKFSYKFQNVLGLIIIIITFLLSFKGITTLF
ncbi:MAG: Nramp family divalent metal transporter [Bacteroidota bacterium]